MRLATAGRHRRARRSESRPRVSSPAAHPSIPNDLNKRVQGFEEGVSRVEATDVRESNSDQGVVNLVSTYFSPFLLFLTLLTSSDICSGVLMSLMILDLGSRDLTNS